MMVIRCKHRVAYMALVLLMSLQLSVFGERVARHDAAIAKARRFAVQVGWTNQGRPQDKDEAKLGSSPRRPHNWQVRMGKLSVEVDSLTGAIKSAYRAGATAGRNHDTVAISESDANKRARAYAQAAGMTLAGLELESSKAGTISGTPGAMRWHVAYRRTYNGYPFLSEGVEMDLDPLDGSLIGFGDSRSSRVPGSTVVNLTAQAAKDDGRKYLSELGLVAGRAISARLYIVQPDSMYEYWEVRGPYPPEPTGPRLAWVVEYDAPCEKTAVYVDSADGQVLGGSISGNASGKLLFPALANITTAAIAVTSGPDGPPSTSLVSGDADILVKAIHSLRSSVVPNCPPPPVRITLISPERTYTFGYSASGHCLLLLTKTYKGVNIKCNMAWETDEAFEKLMSKYINP